jgi:(p)ppGpp synthase/HD superfamily hydrolase
VLTGLRPANPPERKSPSVIGNYKKRETMSTIEKAIEIAINAHKDQKDKSGAPYILHLIRVMEMGKNETEKVCGILLLLILQETHSRTLTARPVK